jgi:uncharacterized protein YhaN
MRIREIQVERYGAWHDGVIPLVENGLNVLYGPNEAGKSTIMRLVRRLLFGFRPDDELGPGARPRRVACAGGLTFTDAGQEYVLRRESEPGIRGQVTLTSEGGGAIAPEALHQILGGVSEQAYEHLFAIGLEELQQLATLQGEDVARHIFDMTLGPEGDRIVAACRCSDRFRQSLWDGARDQGELRTLGDRLEELERGVTALGNPLEEVQRLQRERRRIEADVLDQEQRRHGLHEQLRGHLFLQRVRGPWHRQRQLQQQRAALDIRVEFPENGMERLEALTREMAEHRRQLRAVRRQVRTSVREAAGLTTDARVDAHLRDVQRLLERSSPVSALRADIRRRREQAEEFQGELDKRQARLGSGWTEQRMASVDASPAAAAKLCVQAQAYRLALARRSRYLRRYQRLAALVQQDQSEHAERLRGIGGRDFDEMYDELTTRTAALQAIRQAQARMAAGDIAASLLRRHRECVAERQVLPPYYYGVLGAFGMGGAAMILLGLLDVLHTIRGGPAPWLVGAIFLLLGTCCAAVTWTMKRQFDPPVGLLRELDARLETLERDVSAERTGLASLLEQFPTEATVEPDAPAQDVPLVRPDRLDKLQAELHQRQAELKDLEQCELALRERRQRLSRMRGRLRDRQRRVSEARRAWCLLLKEVGLEETVRIRPAIEAWQLVGECRELQRRRTAADDAVSLGEEQVREFDGEISRLAEAIDGTGASQQEAGERLAGWRTQLEACAAARARRRALRSTVRRLRRELERHSARVRQLGAARLKLLASVGATSQEEFRDLHRRRTRCRELDQQLDQAGRELAAAARTEPELAVVEDDLAGFDEVRNQHAIETIRAELADLERDLAGSHEQLGRLRQEMQSRESDRTHVRLRRNRAQVAAELDHAVLRYCAAERAAGALDTLRDRLERRRQPETLTRAGRYLADLTAGKYARVWTPAGERRLIIDDDQRHSLRVEQLSSGTREQLFLAIRLALLEQQRERGVELPIILDDVIANFDQVRTEAAIETLVRFAACGGQMLLFTCHLHLARLFEDAGISPVRLPEPHPVVERRRVG